MQQCPPETLIKLNYKMTAIKMKPGSHVSTWTRIEDMFQGGISTSIPVNFKEMSAIFTRWAVKADPESNTEGSLCLVLEGLPCGKMDINKISKEGQEVIHGGGAKVFMLWSEQVSWFSPSPRRQLCTSPGLFVKDKKVSKRITDPIVRWYIGYALDMSRRGDYTTGEGWYEYLMKPHCVPSPNSVPFGFILNFQATAEDGKWDTYMVSWPGGI